MATRLQRLRRGEFSEAFPFAGPAFRRAAPWLMGLVLLASLVTRLHPTIRYAVWGSDSGEYLFLTERLVETGRISFAYDGWGLAYPYFPGMFVVSGAVTAVIGVDLFHAVQWTTPVLSALMAVLVGLLAYRISSDPRVGVLSAAFVATSATVVITTSHAMPGTLGQVLMLGLLALLPDAYRDRGSLVVLAILGVALVLTHHLTTYFAIGAVAFAAFLREMTQRATDPRRLRVDVALGGGLLVLAAIWWLGVADPFRDEIVGDALPFPPLVTAFLFLAGLAALPAAVWWKRRRSDWHWTPRYPQFPKQWITAAVAAVGIWLVILYAVVVGVPGSDISSSPIALAYVLPVLAFLAFLPLGHAAVGFHRSGTLALGWLYSVIASLLFAMVTSSRILFPFRHVDYLAMAMAPLAAIGLTMAYDQTLASRIPSDRASTRAIMIGGVVAILAVSAILSLPPREVIGGFEEGITAEEMEAVRWVAAHPEVVPPGSTFAADHRISSMLFGIAGVRPTWDSTFTTYHAEDARVALAELARVYAPGLGDVRVDHVFLSPPIERGVTLVQWENSLPMAPAAVAKFEDPTLFEKLYEEDAVRIYRVRWEGVGEGPS